MYTVLRRSKIKIKFLAVTKECKSQFIFLLLNYSTILSYNMLLMTEIKSTLKNRKLRFSLASESKQSKGETAKYENCKRLKL